MARDWTENELLIAMNVYCKLPFGKLTSRTPLIVQVAKMLNRTPSSLSMKLCNLASFDPALRARGIKGLRAASRADKAMWDSFSENWNTMSEESELAFESLMGRVATESPDIEAPLATPSGPSEAERLGKSRRHQTFFRNTVLASYEYRCAISGMMIPQLLVASHIIPWSEDESRRADPTNGLCLNALYDRAFDRGLITFDEDFRLVVSQVLKKGKCVGFQTLNFINIEGSRITLPHRFAPDKFALEIHRSRIFKN